MGAMVLGNFGVLYSNIEKLYASNTLECLKDLIIK